MSAYINDPRVRAWEGCYLVDDPQGRGTWKVVQANDGWIARGKDPADWQVLGIFDAAGAFVSFQNEQFAIAAIIGEPQ